MTTKELMVGDWVLMDMNYLEEDPMYTKTDYKPHKIQNGEDIDLACETNCIGDGDVYRPIPLTPEILEKNGFVYKDALYNTSRGVWVYNAGNRNNIYVQFTDKVAIEIHNEINKRDNKGRADLVTFCRDWCDALFVHELQHALRLCGIEKEFEIEL